ncbi:MAG TPA: radical SAM protein [bacterium]|nr:radical SAM protein [bacterium]
MTVREVTARTILTKTGIPGINWCLNPYVGCQHACAYCYATFMKKYSGHDEPWGEFVDAKINAPGLLKRELRRRREGRVVVSSVTDCYQPLEARFKLTRACLEILAISTLEVSILTKSDLVVRDIDLFKRMPCVEVGLTITTDREDIHQMFEPHSSAIADRLAALKQLSKSGVSTYVFIGPVLPMNPEKLAEAIAPYTKSVLIDRMNYPWKARQVYVDHDLKWALDPVFFEETQATLVARLERHGIETEVV